MITLVLAMARNGVIGKDGAIPWRLPEDLKRFKALTLGHPVMMGRKTWDALPRKPLPGRRNIVISCNPDWQAEGADAMSLATALALPDVMVIGGAQIYRAVLDSADRIELTEVDADIEGDAVFHFDRTGWIETRRESHRSEDGLGYSFVTLERASD